MSKTILIVDDNYAVLDAVGRALAKDHDIVIRGSALQAIEDLKQGGIDLLITDLRMPPPSGFALIKAARQISADLPVIVISAHVDEDDPNNAPLLRQYCDYVLEKPFRKKDLLAMVRHLLDERQDTHDSDSAQAREVVA